MLIQFRFKNFRSFREDTILDLSASKITEHSERVIKIAKEKLLPTAAIYGANASGKSTVIEAFRFMNDYVLDSFFYGGDSESLKNEKRRITCKPFLFDDNARAEESLFEVYFVDTKENGYKSYNYGFTLKNNEVIEEWLNYKSKTAREYKPIFYRSPEELDLSGIDQKSQENIRIALEKETLVVSLGAKLKIAKLKSIRDWFFNNDFANFSDPIENVFLASRIPQGFVTDKKVQEQVVGYLSSFDPSIVGFDVDIVSKDNGNVKLVKINAKHKMTNGGTTSIPLGDESDGTLKMFALYPFIHNALTNGGVLFVDELNARLHPLLVRNVIISFLNPQINNNNAQLVFTTHDSWQLSNELLRRDEIWFTEKDNNGMSSLYSLADFSDEDGTKIRKDESYEKNYLLGKYGAIPVLKSL